MSTIFHFASPVQISPTFGRGILPYVPIKHTDDHDEVNARLDTAIPAIYPPEPTLADVPSDRDRRASHSSLDAAWETGRVAAMTDECPVFAPSHFSFEEASEFAAGAAHAARQVADWDAEVVQMVEERELVRMVSCGMAY